MSGFSVDTSALGSLHGHVRSRWSGCLGQVVAHRADGVEIIMDDGDTLILRDQADIDDFEWLGDDV